MHVIELSEQTLVSISDGKDVLRRLYLTRLHLDTLPEKCIEQLIQLRRLDVSDNNLTEDSFPASLQRLDLLVEINANRNKIVKVPRVFKKLKSLKRLKLSENHLRSAEGFDQLKGLTLLILDHNDIETIPRKFCASMKKLEFFHCAGNRVSELPSDIRHMRSLRDLDLSHNQLSTLPTELFLLPKLDVIQASGNRIVRIPTPVNRHGIQKKLSAVELSENLISQFPESLLTMAHKISLNNNKLRTIPVKVLKILSFNTVDELTLKGNPLVSPPAEVCESGIR